MLISDVFYFYYASLRCRTVTFDLRLGCVICYCMFRVCVRQ